MSGFPNRPNRKAFGPKYLDDKPVRDPQKEVSAQIGNLGYHQVAGLGVVSCLAWALIDVSAETVLAHAEAWNPNGETASPFDPPTFAKTATGDGELTYNSTYPDEDGVDVATNFAAGLATLQEFPAAGNPYAMANVKAGTTNVMRVRVGGSAPEDLIVLVVIF